MSAQTILTIIYALAATAPDDSDTPLVECAACGRELEDICGCWREDEGEWFCFGCQGCEG